MVGKDQGGPRAQTLHLFRLALGGALQFDIDQLAARRAGFPQNVQLGGQRALELSPAGGAPAGGDGDHVGMVFHEALDPGKRQRGLGKVI